MRTATAKDYREAARMIAEGENTRCCCAIADAMKNRKGVAYESTAPLFHYLYMEHSDSWSNWWTWSPRFPKTQHYRVIALLLAAEIWEDENGKK